MVHKTKRFKVDFSDMKSITKAEKMKAMLENKGYNLKSTKQIGFDKWVGTYERDE